MFNKLKNSIKKRWAFMLYLFFVWLVPIIMLNEFISLVEVNVAFKITFSGCLVLIIVLLGFRKKIYAIINNHPHGLIRGILLCLHKAVLYGLILGIMWGISSFSDKFFNWWLLCGISWIIGFIFLMVDENNCMEKIDERKQD